MGQVGLAKALRLREEQASAEEEGQDHQFRTIGTEVEFLVELDSKSGIGGGVWGGVDRRGEQGVTGRHAPAAIEPQHQGRSDERPELEGPSRRGGQLG
jgi:hypothetical protein